MNDRKQHVIQVAHQLFIEKGFQATSIQDIIECSGISKGTFYNYFPSKNELLKALLKSIYQKMEIERNELLIGKSPADLDIFIKQVELLLHTNRAHSLITLFEEVMSSSDEDLKQFLKEGQLKTIRWLYQRFLDLYGEEKKPYLLDSAIMFLGILYHNLKYSRMAYGSDFNYPDVVRYSVERIVKMIQEMTEVRSPLFPPELLHRWLPESNPDEKTLQQNLQDTIAGLKKDLSIQDDPSKYLAWLDFIQDELLYTSPPREFLIESVLASLQAVPSPLKQAELQQLQSLVDDILALRR
ncbi:TetR/AcrR family transcriptional regulator [Ammoniphilus sp. YIM 78166]|uniref:TetR/AcrR family transcriptional regulator n=1 Tax=Ammoniphilus sp. YIM 78166 TaxID=1644106 RepID=UPI00106FC0F6|nr:TetR/AcrR family transcriptional regulator [Ammoniphilus sp. YIM 78166]